MSTGDHCTNSIERITFLVHPYCYAESLGGSTPMPKERWRAYHEHEIPVARRWYEAIDRADERDVIVYHPCYQSIEEKSLAEYGRRRLGERFLRLPGRQVGDPRGFTPETLAAIGPEIDKAFQVRGNYVWYAHDLRIAVFSYNYAQDILAYLRERDIRFDRDSLTLRAMGESFEGCVTTWTTMVPVYLGVPARVEIPYEMTVPDAFFLLKCHYVGRIPMPFDTALYLFVDPEDRPLALYKRERVRLADPSYYSRIPLDADRIYVRNREGEVLLPPGGELSPTVPPSLVRRTPQGIEVMVSSGRGRGGEGPPFYPREAPLFIFARDVKPEVFFEAAERAEILPERIR